MLSVLVRFCDCAWRSCCLVCVWIVIGCVLLYGLVLCVHCFLRVCLCVYGLFNVCAFRV